MRHCDVCDQKADYEDCVISLSAFKEIEQHKIDLCYDCQSKVLELLNLPERDRDRDPEHYSQRKPA